MRRRDAAARLLPGPQCLDEHHRLALVIDRAAGDETLAVRPVDELRLERRAGPQLQRIDRLHVVMAVEQDMRAAIAVRPGVVREHDRMPGGGAQRGGEAQAGKLAAHPFGRPHAIR